jgi:hypothetical protein
LISAISNPAFAFFLLQFIKCFYVHPLTETKSQPSTQRINQLNFNPLKETSPFSLQNTTQYLTVRNKLQQNQTRLLRDLFIHAASWNTSSYVTHNKWPP